MWWSNKQSPGLYPTFVGDFSNGLHFSPLTPTPALYQSLPHPYDSTPRRRRRPVLIGYQTPLVSNPTIASCGSVFPWLYLRMHVPSRSSPMSSDDLGEAGDDAIRCALPRRPQTRCVAINRSNPAQLSPDSLSLLVAGTCEIAAP